MFRYYILMLKQEISKALHFRFFFHEMMISEMCRIVL